MAVVKTLRDGNNRKVYPVTSTNAIVNPNGGTLTDYVYNLVNTKATAAEAIRDQAYATKESQRDATFNSKESQRDAAMEIISQEASQLEDIASKLNTFPKVEESGFFVADENENVCLKYDSNGFDVANISEHFKTLLRGVQTSFTEVVESGFFVVDSNLNIGFSITTTGIHANNILEYEIVNI